MSSKSSTGSTLSRSRSSRRRGTISHAGSPRLDVPTQRPRSRRSPSRAFPSGRRTSSPGASLGNFAPCCVPPKSCARRRSALSGERAFPICKIASPSNGGRCEHWRGSGATFSPTRDARRATRSWSELRRRSTRRRSTKARASSSAQAASPRSSSRPASRRSPE